MDAAARAELDALRRRAFGPNPDLHDDPAAVARLIELEELAQPRITEKPDAADVPEPSSVSPSDHSPAASGAELPDVPGRRFPARRGTLIAGIAAVAVIVGAVVITQPRAEPLPTASPSPRAEPPYVFTADANSKRLMSIRLDASFGGYIQLPSETPPPEFSATPSLAWTNYLGAYYGWDLWVAGGSGAADDEHCILLRRADVTHVRCGREGAQREGLLQLTLAGSDIPPEELPEPMSAEESIRFWWLDSGAVEVVLGLFDSE